MATFFDIDDPIIRRLNFKQIGDDFAGLYRVAPRWDPLVEHTINPQEDYAPDFQEMIDFVQSDALLGQMYVEYYDPFKMAASNGGRIVRYHSINFYFTDSATAFAFKMRFG
jgi:hypothetical protein